MLPEEKESLLALFDHESRWCQDAEARDANGGAVHFDSEDAVAWDLAGAVCRLFGWKRALELFGQISRHMLGRYRRSTLGIAPITAMSALVDYNDNPRLDYDGLWTKLKELPVSARRSQYRQL